MHARVVVYIYLAWGKVSCLERCPQFKCMQERLYLGWGKVSCLERCPQFKCMQERLYVLGVGKGVLFREVSSVQRCPFGEVPLYTYATTTS